MVQPFQVKILLCVSTGAEEGRATRSPLIPEHPERPHACAQQLLSSGVWAGHPGVCPCGRPPGDLEWLTTPLTPPPQPPRGREQK